jgi:pimeloyl-ACP methyl ester carboxylesterase
MAAIQRPQFDPVRESIGMMDALARLPLSTIGLATLPRGNGSPVMVLPGFMTGDGSTFVLRSFLRSLNYRVHGWGMGVNRGEITRLVRDVTARVEELADHAEEPVRLVGWSLGGVVAREIARRRPELVHSIVTMGTPVVGGAKYTAAAPIYERMFGQGVDAMEAVIAANNKVPIRVPVTAIYTRSDNVVAWEACIDPDNAEIEHIEVGTTHVGLGFSPEVFRIVATRLARNPDSRV